MSRRFEFDSARLGTFEVSQGAIELDEAKRELEATYEKRSLFHKERLSLARLTFDAQTKVSSGKSELTVGDLTVRMADGAQLAELTKCVMAPKEEACALAVRAFTNSMDAAAGFLAKRVAALSSARRLGSSPREVLIASASAVPDDAEDPVAALVQSLEMDLRAAYGRARESLSAGAGSIGDRFVQRAYALIFAVELYQDWLGSGDQSKLEQVSALMTELGLPAPSEDRGNSTEEDLSVDLFSSGVTALLSQVRESFGVGPVGE